MVYSENKETAKITMSWGFESEHGSFITYSIKIPSVPSDGIFGRQGNNQNHHVEGLGMESEHG